MLAKRSPGSTLKPFVYALALDQGVLHPQTMLRDLPTSFGPFTPENFDGRFFGPITAEAALIRSRNIPAVWVATQLRQPTRISFCRVPACVTLKPESFYGLALALGGGEVTMEELAGLVRHARQPGRAAAASDRAPRARATRACGCSVPRPASSRSTCCAAIRGPMTSGTVAVARAVARRLEDGHVVGLPRRLVRRRRRTVRPRRLDRRLRGAGQSRVHRRRCRGAAVLPHRGRAQPGAGGRSRAAARAAARRQQSRCVRGQRRSAECALPAHGGHLVHPGQVADPRQPVASSRRDRCGDRPSGSVRRIRPAHDSKCSSSGRPTC